MKEVTLSSKNQIVVPREAREALGAKPGSRLLIVVRNGTVIILTKPKNHSTAIRGLSKKHYPIDYLETERESWKKASTPEISRRPPQNWTRHIRFHLSGRS